MSKKYDLMTVGLTTLDVTIYPVSSLPEPDSGEIVETIKLTPAGTAAGTALIAQTLGLSACVVSAVGSDPQGSVVRTMLDEAGVETSMLATLEGMPTSTTVLPVRPDGQHPNFHMLGASVMASLPEAAWASLEDTAAVHWAGVGFPGLRESGPAFLEAARKAGAFVTCDLIAPTDAAREDIDGLLPHVDLFMPSLAEMRFLAGTQDPDAAAQAFMAKGAGACLFKMGAEGALLITPGMRLQVPAFSITPKDTTSCGDSVCAAWHVARSRGLAPEEALRFAAATAALVAQDAGTTGLLSDFESTLAFARTAPQRSEVAA